MSGIILALHVIAASLGVIFLKLGSSSGAAISFAGSKLNLNINPYISAGIFLYGVSFILYMYLISKFDLGYIIPIITGLVYIIVFVASYIIFKESFTISKVLGIALILVGILLINLSRTN